ncbi:hypothetical protein L6164_006376 [Bauhinia variegata]|uniref:Uncharacterized protein n=1 Tax=Bauhinia variegata TaxID=167791 RepID=A0ACB9PTL2_BAUVA|nr:hypothetical protein L6164_006376 [Bauhinia variegata]
MNVEAKLVRWMLALFFPQAPCPYINAFCDSIPSSRSIFGLELLNNIAAFPSKQLQKLRGVNESKKAESHTTPGTTGSSFIYRLERN